MHKFGLVVFSLMVSFPLICADKKKIDSSVMATVIKKELDEEFIFNAHRGTSKSKGILASTSDQKKQNVQALAQRIYALPQRSASLPTGIGITIAKKQDCTGLGRNCPCDSCVEHYAPARQGYVSAIEQLILGMEKDKDTSST